MNLLQPVEVGARLHRRGLGLRDLRLRRGERRLVLDDGIAKPRGVEAGERLAPHDAVVIFDIDVGDEAGLLGADLDRSEEHTSELQSLMRTSYAVFCLKKKIKALLSTAQRTKTTEHN